MIVPLTKFQLVANLPRPMVATLLLAEASEGIYRVVDTGLIVLEDGTLREPKLLDLPDGSYLFKMRFNDCCGEATVVGLVVSGGGLTSTTTTIAPTTTTTTVPVTTTTTAAPTTTTTTLPAAVGSLFRLSETSGGLCSATPQTLYYIPPFAPGCRLYLDGGLSVSVDGMWLFVAPENDLTFGLDSVHSGDVFTLDAGTVGPATGDSGFNC